MVLFHIILPILFIYLFSLLKKNSSKIIFIILLFTLSIGSIPVSFYLEKHTSIHFPFAVYLYSLLNYADNFRSRVYIHNGNELKKYDVIIWMASEYQYLLTRNIDNQNVFFEDTEEFFNHQQLKKNINKKQRILIICIKGGSSFLHLQHLKLLGYLNVNYSKLEGALIDESYYKEFHENIFKQYNKILFIAENNFFKYKKNVVNINYKHSSKEVDENHKLREKILKRIIPEMSDNNKAYLLIGNDAKIIINDLRIRTKNNNIFFSEINMDSLNNETRRNLFIFGYYKIKCFERIAYYNSNKNYLELLIYLEKLLNIELKSIDPNYEFISDLTYQEYIVYRKLGNNKQAIHSIQRLRNLGKEDKYADYLFEMRDDHFMSSEKFYELKKIYENAYFLLPRKAINQYKKVLNQGYLENEIYQYLARCYYEIHDYKNALKYLDQYIAVMHDDDSINCNVQLNKFKILIALNNKNKIIEYIKYISISNCVSSFKFRNSLIKEILSIKNIKTRLEIIDLFIEYLGGSDDNEIVDDLFFNKIIILNKLNRYEEVVLLIDCKYKERYKNEYTKAFIGILTKLYKAKKYSQSIALLNQKFYLFDYDYVDDFNTIITNIFEDNLILDDQFIAVSNKCLNSNYVNNKLKILILIRQHSFYKDIKNDKPNAISAVNHALQILPDNSYLLFLKNHYYRKSLTMKKQKEKGDLLEKAFKYEEKQNIDKAIKFYEKILKIDDTDREIYRNIIRLAIQNNTISTYLKIVDFWITKNKNDNLVDFYPYSVKLQLLFDNKETELMLKILDDLKHDINYKEYQNEIELWYFYIYRDLLKDNKKNMPYILGFKFDNKFELLYRKKLSYADNYKINKILVQLNKTKNIKRKIKYIEKILEIDNTDNYRGLLLANLYFKNKDYSKSLEVINQFIVFLEKSDVYVSSLLIQKMYIYKAIGNIEEVQIIKKVLLGETNFIEPLSDSQRQFIKDF